ncbi:MAG: TetR family transcriptional regulator [Candidatus Puniceispirillaceae bacterium]
MQSRTTAISARTADAILAAARRRFSSHGYDGTGLRAIADLAGVNVALIGRYFGSKEGLFLAAVPPTLDISALMGGPMSEFGMRAATIMDMRSHRGFDPMLALIRAAASPACAPALKTALDRQVIAPLAMRLDGMDARPRAGMILATMAGYDLMIRVIGIEALQGATGAQRRDGLAAALQHIVDMDASPG